MVLCKIYKAVLIIARISRLSRNTTLLQEYLNPRWADQANSIDISPRYPIDSPAIIDPNEYPRHTWYQGNRKVKRSNVQIEWTPEMLEELRRCKEDIIYFAERYFYIRTLDHGRIKIPLYDYQKEFLRASELSGVLNMIFLAARQSAKSTTLTVRLLHALIFKDDYEIVILANKGATAREIFSRVKLAYEELPLWLQTGSIEWNKGSVILDNNSKVFAASTSSDSVRGFSPNEVLIDEFAFVKNDKEFYKSTLPVISSGTTGRLTMVSTPNGKKGVFYKTWLKALAGKSNFFSLGVPWYLVPGRDDAWKKKTIEDSSMEDFMQEHGIQFRGNSTTLIDADTLEKIELEQIDNPIEVTEDVDIFDVPIPGNTYLAIVDTSEGKGLDFSTFSIIDISSIPYRQVASFSTNTMSPMVYGIFITRFLEYYNMATVLIENNNVSGALVAYQMHSEIEYDNVYCMHGKDETGIGIRTTAKVKSIGCTTLKGLLKSGTLELRCQKTLDELHSFEASGSSYAAAEGTHDDRAMNLVLFAWYTTQEEFAEFLEADSIAEEIHAEEIDHIMSINLSSEVVQTGKDTDLW